MPIVIDKPPGWSPVEAIEAARKLDPDLATARLGYAGRLDPMAEGVLLALRDGENREAERFRSLDKTYRVQVLFGVATDTFDALGVVMEQHAVPSRERIQAVLDGLIGTFEQKVPAYASHRVNGRPLFHWARRGLADSVPRPTMIRTVTEVAHEGDVEVLANDLCESIVARIANVHGNFRQDEIVSRWRSALAARDQRLLVSTLRITCSSGTFMRAIAHDLGHALDSSAIALAIERLRVGPYDRSIARDVRSARTPPV